MNSFITQRLTLAALVFGFCGALSANAATIFVRPGGAGAQNGTSWANAYAEVQTALTRAPGGSEIWVAAGTYRPDLGTNDPAMRFSLRNNVAIYGGFNGTETAREQRNYVANQTILSGDIGTLGNSGDNAYRVVYASGADSSAVLDGFTIQDGNALLDPSGFRWGGGIRFDTSSVTLRNLVIRNCQAFYGAGMFAINPGSSPLALINVVFQNNSSGGFGGTAGSGLCMFDVGEVTIAQCQFLGNSAVTGGGAAILLDSQATFSDCLFDGNHALDAGGGLSVRYTAQAQLTGVTFRNNTADNIAGAVHSEDAVTINMNNCQVLGNSAAIQGGALYGVNDSINVVHGCEFVGNVANQNYGAIVQNTGALTIVNSTITHNATPGAVGGVLVAGGAVGTYTNSILWNNSDSTGMLSSSQYSWTSGNPVPNVTYCNFNGATGATWFATDPLFYRAPSPGGDGVWGTGDDDYGDLRIDCSSPLADAGNNSAVPPELISDLGGLPRLFDNPYVVDTGIGTPPIVDLGAHESHPNGDCGTCFLPDGSCTAAVSTNCTSQGGIFAGGIVSCGDPAFIVDRLAAPGGDGTAGAPFMTFGEAAAAASPGVTTTLLINRSGHYAQSVSFTKPTRFANLTGAPIRIGD